MFAYRFRMALHAFRNPDYVELVYNPQSEIGTPQSA